MEANHRGVASDGRHCTAHHGSLTGSITMLADQVGGALGAAASRREAARSEGQPRSRVPRRPDQGSIGTCGSPTVTRVRTTLLIHVGRRIADQPQIAGYARALLILRQRLKHLCSQFPRMEVADAGSLTGRKRAPQSVIAW